MTIRDSFAPDVGGLGKKIERPKPDPKVADLGNGVYRGADGKLFTNRPVPPTNVYVGQPVWPFAAPAKPAADENVGDC